MKLSVIIPAYNEEGIIEKTVLSLYKTLKKEKIPHEILIVNDNSKDGTEAISKKLEKIYSSIRYINNTGKNGFGQAIRYGLESFKGDCVAIYMADSSDSPKDLILFYKELGKGYDCVFGTRWSKGGKTYKYPKHKLLLNRLVNWSIKFLFGFFYDDTTNAFKLYKKEVISGLKPFLSNHFNLTVELPLKAIIRGYSYTVVGNSWTNRTVGTSNLKLREMGSRYLFIIIYCFIEKWLVREDYKKN